MEKSKEERLRDLLCNVRCETEEILFILGKMPDADKAVIAACDRLLRVLNDD